ncbi:uncharacterized protein [Dermacentor albipictus]|uniref:uncharacterized protein n=1 Tax=Dermacentor albipictus TaxID=60249 RepID=UPI0031FE0C39
MHIMFNSALLRMPTNDRTNEHALESYLKRVPSPTHNVYIVEQIKQRRSVLTDTWLDLIVYVNNTKHGVRSALPPVMEFLKPPEPLRLSGDIAKQWKLFKQKFELFLAASVPRDKPRDDSTKTALLLSLGGEDVLEIYNNFTFTEDAERMDYATVIKKFDEYCAAQVNEIHERYLFRRRVQAEGEPFEPFARDLRHLAKSCNFGVMENSMIRDQIVFGTSDDKVRQKLLRDKELTLTKAEQVCKSAELSDAQNQLWAREQRQVDHIQARPKETVASPVFKCSRCGREHGLRNCPAFGRTCRRCGGKNHFAVQCKSNRQVAEVNADEDFTILDVSVDTVKSHRDWVAEALVGSKHITLKVDTGAQANLLPYAMYRALQPAAQIRESNAVLRSYGGGIIKHFGVARLKVTVGKTATEVDFFLVKKGRAIIGLEASERLGLFVRSVDAMTTKGTTEFMQEYNDVFTGTGCLQRLHKMVLRQDAVPTVQMARRVPLALLKPLRAELDRMLKAGIIAKVEEPTDWESSSCCQTCCRVPL